MTDIPYLDIKELIDQAMEGQSDPVIIGLLEVSKVLLDQNSVFEQRLKVCEGRLSQCVTKSDIKKLK